MGKRSKEDLVGKVFGEWEVLKQIDNKKCICKCSCGICKEVYIGHLKRGLSKSCGHNTTKFKDLKGKVFGDWEVIEYTGNQKWLCKCSCGLLRDVDGRTLRSGESTSCGHKDYLDLKGQKFWEWTAIEWLGNHLWLCQCSCGTYRVMTSQRLRSGDSKSCGCKKVENYINTLGDRYKGIRNISQLGLTEGVGDYISVDQCKDEINSLFPCENRSIRGIIGNKEIDLYYPEKKFGIEFNGTYWHSSIFKSSTYHRDKSVEANKVGIQLFHIFEYEWLNKDTREKLIDILKSKLKDSDIHRIMGRKCIVKEVSNSEANKFLDENHLQCGIYSKVNVGCYYNNQLIGVMTFGKPRFTGEYQWEMLRFAWKRGVIVIGGSDKIFKYFLYKYKPESIITYCDYSKFSGEVYTRLGFRFDGISIPSYKWVSADNSSILSRYQTMKYKLIKNSLGEDNQSEDEIMSNLGYYKVYDSGHKRFIWRY